MCNDDDNHGDLTMPVAYGTDRDNDADCDEKAKPTVFSFDEHYQK